MVTVDKFVRPRGGGMTRGYFSVEVQAATVQSVINAVNISLGGTLLRAFMEHDVRPYLADQIVDRFAYNGGSDTTWAPLAEATKKIRHEMGVEDDWAINERTGEMLEHLAGNAEVTAGLSTAEIVVPGDPGDEVMHKKIQTAQQGFHEWNPLTNTITHTPARPVLVLNSEDRAAIMIMLQLHIMNTVAGIHNLGPIGSL